jgi:hypothetical protein
VTAQPANSAKMVRMDKKVKMDKQELKVYGQCYTIINISLHLMFHVKVLLGQVARPVKTERTEKVNLICLFDTVVNI